MPDRATANSVGMAAAIVAAALAVAATYLLIREGTQYQRRTLDTAAIVSGGDPTRGKEVIIRSGCGACHDIPGIPAARGRIGPPLATIGQRALIGGMLGNSPENLVQWIGNPRAINPGTAMPALGLTMQQARDAAAYLFSIRAD